MNAHSELWGYDDEDEKGQQLINHINQLRLLVLNNPNSLPTFETTHLRGWPDISLTSMNLFPYFSSWEVEREVHLGDHRLITLELDLRLPVSYKRRYRTKNVSHVGLQDKVGIKIKRIGCSIF